MPQTETNRERRREFFRRVVFWTPRLLDSVGSGKAVVCEIGLGQRRYPNGRRVKLKLVAVVMDPDGGGTRVTGDDAMMWCEGENDGTT